MASLLTLPLELLVTVSSHLQTPDLCALRITCKQVEKSLYEWFSQEFFTKKQFMLTHKSLQALIDISKHVSFSQKLTHIIIATNVYADAPLRFRDEAAAVRYIKGFEDQKALLSTGVDREMLTEAFKNLVNLQVVGIRDFNANNRRREGDGATWSSWGAPTVYQETGIELLFTTHAHFAETAIGFTARMFQNLIYALGKANATPIEIEVLLRRHALPDAAFHVSEFVAPTVKPLLSQLKTLLLNVDPSLKMLHTHTNGTALDTQPGRSLRAFLALTPNLDHLRLNFQKWQYRDNEAFLEWLGQTAKIPSVDPFDPTPVFFPKLTQLELGQLDVQPHLILNVITKFATTLEYVCLWRMSLSYRKTNVGTQPNIWATLFRDIANLPQMQLTRFKVGMLQQDHMLVGFKLPDSEGEPLKLREYSGANIAAFFDELVEQCTVQWPEPIVGDDNDDDDEGMDDYEDEDMNDENEDDGEEESGDED